MPTVQDSYVRATGYPEEPEGEGTGGHPREPEAPVRGEATDKVREEANDKVRLTSTLALTLSLTL